MFPPLMRSARLGVLALAVATPLPASLAAQKSPPPSNVTVAATCTGVTVAWTGTNRADR